MVSIPGIGSGLDIQTLITQLVSAESDAKTSALAKKKTNFDTQISAFGNLKNALSSFQTSITKLKDPATFTGNQVTSSKTDVFTASSIGNLAANNYNIEVLESAQAQKLLSPGFASAGAAVGTGTLTIGVGGNTFSVTIGNDQETLAGIRDAINGAADNTGVTASIVNVDNGLGGTVSKLVLTANGSGTDNLLSVVVNDNDLTNTNSTGLSALYYDTGDANTPEQMTEIVPAVNASIKIDGQLVTSSSNTIVDAIQGITINVLKKDPGNTYAMTAAVDKQGVSTAVNSFISSYNSLMGLINKLTMYDPKTGNRGQLLGDQTVLTLNGQLRRELNHTVTGMSGSIDNLVALGITSNADGTLTLNSSKLDNSLNENFDSVKQLFSSTDGIANRFDTLLHNYMESSGILDTKTTGLNKSGQRVNDDLTALGKRMDDYRQNLLKQYTALDGLLTQMQSTASFLQTQLSSIANISKG